MSVRTKMLGFVDVILRVPPIFIIDEILKISMGLPFNTQTNDPTLDTNHMSIMDGAITSAATTTTTTTSAASDADNNILVNGSSSISSNLSNSFSAAAAINSTLEQIFNETTNSMFGGGEAASAAAAGTAEAFVDDTEFYKLLSLTTLKFFSCLLGCLVAVCIFMLWTRHLVIVYMYIVSIGLIFLSYWSNVSAIALIADAPCLLEDILALKMDRLLDTNGVAVAILPHLVAQWIIGVIFSYIHLGPKYKSIQTVLPFSFLMPLLLAMLPLPPPILKHSPAFAAIMPLALSKIALWSSAFDIAKTLLNGVQHAKNFAHNFGLSALLENEWQRLNVPCVLRAFWTIRIGEQLLAIVLSSKETISYLSTVQHLLVSGCETLTAVLGMTSIVSLICYYIGKMFQWFLLSEDYDEDKSIGTVSAILFYILALQTGLTSLSPDKRFIRLCRNFCLLITALLHFLHNIVAPILMSLSAARNPSRKRHIRALCVCAFLLIAPILLLTALWARHSPSTWLLAVTAFSIEVIVKVIVSLATYTLFLLDARRQTFWEKLDDYVYYIKAFGNSVEFCFGIFLFFNGAWILLFESGGAIRAFMMGIHAYFNIWCEARAGWAVFMKRRTAVHKISSLPEASEEQLQQFDDVCAICYQEMTSAKITRCNHYFHGVCLRKWLYVQDRCPFCHEIIMNESAVVRNTNRSSPNAINGGQDEAIDDDAAAAAGAGAAAAVADSNADAIVPFIDENGIEALEDDIEL